MTTFARSRLKFALGPVLVALLVAFAAPASAQTTHKLHVWIRAFIPAGVPTSAAGRCFKTDERTFDESPTASARITTEFSLVVSGTSVTAEKFAGRPFYRAGESIELNCQNGSVVARRTADVSGMKIGKPAFADNVAQVIGAASAANPLTPPVLSPHVDYDFDIKWNVPGKSVKVRFTVGRFPAFEAYAQADNGQVIKLFSAPPDPGASPYALYDIGVGANARVYQATLNL